MNGPLEYEETKAIVLDFVCAQCEGILSNPWGGAYGINGQVIRCFKDIDHQGIKKKGRETRWLLDSDQTWQEFDIMTQIPVNPAQALALPIDESGMLARMKDAVDVGRFPEVKQGGRVVPLTPNQLANLVKFALLYHLDPLMGEIMPYQGKPFITIEGRRRIDDRAGNHPTFKISPMDRETYASYVAMGAIDEGDIVVVGQFTDSRYGNTIETTGRVLESETQGNDFLPIVKWRLEMALKRCESRGRRQLYGPVALPGGVDALEEDNVIEGEVREIPDTALPEPGPASVIEEPPVVEHILRAQATETDDQEPSEPASRPTPQEEETLTYSAVVDRAGLEGLDQDEFELKVLGCKLETFRRRAGASPEISANKLAAYLDKRS